MRWKLFPATLFLFFIAVSAAKAQQIPGQAGERPLKELNIKYMLRGYFYAGSNIEDSLALGGFGGSDNRPKHIAGGTLLPRDSGGISIFIDTAVGSSFANAYKGYKLFISNYTDTTVSFPASDSRLNTIAEVWLQGAWQPIEYLPSSWCGNSYHRVFLQSREYWEFSVPVYHGKKKTKLRYKLLRGNQAPVYSNEIVASFNRTQLIQKQGHQRQGLMDPYND